MRLLLIEDDTMIAESLSKALRRGGYALDWVEDIESGQLSLETNPYDLVLLDLGLPDGSGLSILKWLRARKEKTPILIITARDTLQDRVAGLDSGADDYILKPFQLEELEARIRAALRRNEGRAVPFLTQGKLSLNPVTHEVKLGPQTVSLSAKEYTLIRALMQNPGSVLSRAQLEEKIYGWNEEVESNAVEYHIHQLRKKLGRNIIRNIRGIGYTIGETA